MIKHIVGDYVILENGDVVHLKLITKEAYRALQYKRAHVHYSAWLEAQNSTEGYWRWKLYDNARARAERCN